MNTTPTTTDGPARIPYTVLGGPRRDRIRRYAFPLTLLVLGRGDRLFRAGLLRDLEERRLGEVVCVEGQGSAADVESLAREFPGVRFILLKAPCSPGEWVTIGVGEAASPLVLVQWSDTRLATFPSSLAAAVEKGGALCTVPAIRNAQADLVPSLQSPVWRHHRLTLAYHVPRRGGERTLFPFDYCGIYNREKYAQTGGYDPAIGNPYWQKLDFGLRSTLWGERLEGSTEFTLSYTGVPPQDDATPDAGYKLFWLKNVAVRHRRDAGVLPAVKALEYMTRSGASPVDSVREFRAVRSWVHTHRYRFQRDARDVVDHWGRS